MPVRPRPTGPLTHIIRSTMPWRALSETECGRPLADVKEALTREEFNTKFSEKGQSHMSLVTCVTCWETASRHPDWSANPMAVVSREMAVWGAKKEEREATNIELKVIALLIARHREEFDELLEDHRETVPLPVRGTGRPTGEVR